jgi:hypothetical protein
MPAKPRHTDLDKRVARAVRHFWVTRGAQGRRQGSMTGQRDAGNRRAATGGKQLDGFNALIGAMLAEAGIPRHAIFHSARANVTLPGFFRPTKQWDVAVVADGKLLASVECKALCGPSFGNNYNNRVEEAVGNAHDIWTAFREGAFLHSPHPFVGYVLLLEEAEESIRPVRVDEKHFEVFPEFKAASYARRCEESLRRLMRERCYNATCLLLSNRPDGRRGAYTEPATDLTFERFAKLMCNQTAASFRSV